VSDPAGRAGQSATGEEPLRRNRQFQLLVGARVVSFAGDQLTVVALILLVHQRYGAGAAVSALLVAHVLPHLSGPVMGTVVDRSDQRTVLRACEAVRALLVATMALTLPALPILVLLVAANALLATTLRPAGRSAIPVLVGGHQLAAANATLATGANLGFAVGPATGGLLVAWVGVSGALMVDVATSVGAVMVLGLLRPLPPAPDPRGGRLRLLFGTREGMSYVWRQPVTRVLAIALFAGVSLAGIVLVAGVFLVRDPLGAGPVGYGAFSGAWGLGMIAASVVLALGGGGSSPTTWLVLGFAAQAAGLAGAGLAPHLALAVAAAAAGGTGNALEDVATDTILQQVVPRELLGRAVGAVYTGSFAGELVAYAAGGPLVDLMGPRALFVAGGCALAVVTGWVAVAMRRPSAGLAAAGQRSAR
jgi:MFS family permease